LSLINVGGGGQAPVGVACAEETAMAFEDLQAEIASLLIRMNEQPEDVHEVEQILRGKLNEYRAFGLPLPEDLAELEALLDRRFSDEEQEEQT
jgi:hypothetical protein